MKKRCIWLIFLLCLVVCLASCGKNNNDGSDGKLEPIPTVPSYSGNTVIKATVSGTVAVKDDVATCTVTGRSIDRFFGSDVESFTLVLIDSNELRYRGDQQGMVGDRDIFSRN